MFVVISTLVAEGYREVYGAFAFESNARALAAEATAKLGDQFTFEVEPVREARVLSRQLVGR